MTDTETGREPGDDHLRDRQLLESRLDYAFEDREMFVRALTHRSYLTEHPEVEHDNQRLEYLGDAVLGLVIADALFQHDDQVDEGVLSKRESRIVRKSALARVARDLGLGDFLRVGKGEVLSGGRDRASVLADAYEALLGAIYLDGGFGEAKRVVLRLQRDLLEEATTATRPSDFKSRLQEATQRRRNLQPVYEIIDESGPAHDKTFVAEVRVDDERLGVGRGRSKQRAEQEAAAEALEAVQSEEQ